MQDVESSLEARSFPAAGYPYVAQQFLLPSLPSFGLGALKTKPAAEALSRRISAGSGRQLLLFIFSVFLSCFVNQPLPFYFLLENFTTGLWD